jgi:hypothetical protein
MFQEVVPLAEGGPAQCHVCRQHVPDRFTGYALAAFHGIDIVAVLFSCGDDCDALLAYAEWAMATHDAPFSMMAIASPVNYDGLVPEWWAEYGA